MRRPRISRALLLVPLAAAGWLLWRTVPHGATVADAGRAEAASGPPPPLALGDHQALLDAWTLPGARVIGNAMASGATVRTATGWVSMPSVYTRQLTTDAPLPRLWAFYAPKVGVSPRALKVGPPVAGSGTASGKGGTGSFTAAIAGGVSTVVFSQETPRYVLSAFVARPTGADKTASVMLHLSPR